MNCLRLTQEQINEVVETLEATTAHGQKVRLYHELAVKFGVKPHTIRYVYDYKGYKRPRKRDSKPVAAKHDLNQLKHAPSQWRGQLKELTPCQPVNVGTRKLIFRRVFNERPSVKIDELGIVVS